MIRGSKSQGRGERAAAARRGYEGNRMRTITSFARGLPFRRMLVGFVITLLVVTGFAGLILSLTWPDVPVIIHVRWKPDVTAGQRVELERRFKLADAEYSEGTTWRYRLL